MEYQATFGIDCGVSPGYGVKYPDNVERTETFSADSPQVAHQTAMRLAGSFADDYLSSPKDNFTTVKLLTLRNSCADVPFDPSKSVVKRHMLEHLLSLAPESKPQE
jgi:hypothetical protein